ncbi:MAG TPA: IS21 family transposase [Gemmataceae bacterium]|nr:IS21 family transposase [Gemmataceae bacterium]
MNEELRHEIVRRRQGGASMRRIARDLGLTRETVQSVLRRWQAERAGQESADGVPARRPSRLDPYNETIRQLLARYPDVTIVRVFQELRAQGFTGGLTVVRERVLELRPQPLREPVRRFETLPGVQAQMDYSSYDIDFTEECRRRVHLFSYVLGYSRRQYLRFVESQDLPTTLREHVRAFAHLGGVAATCLYDTRKVVVLRHGDEGPLYNPKFLAFATHYGFTPQACRVRRGQTKGKVERPFWYAETNLLNGRTFRSLAHLNEVTAWWLAQVADVRVHRETKQRPLDRHAEEHPHLLPLPATPYDMASVAYRVVNVEGFVVYQQNSYSVPWRYLGQALPVRVTETEVIVYGARLEEIARHRLWPRGQTGQRSEEKAHRPSADPRRHEALLRQRFAELGPLGERFLDGLLRGQRYGKEQALKLLALQGSYTRVDLLAALERAVRFGAYTLSAVERILAAQARPKSCFDVLAEQERRHLPASLRDNPVSPRRTTGYQHLVEEATDHGPPPVIPPTADDPPRPDAGPGRPA